MPTLEFMAQALTSRLLKQIPLLFVKGETAYHPKLGVCEILAIRGPRKRLVSYRRPDAQPGEDQTGEVWLDVYHLEDFEWATRTVVQSLTDDEKDMGQGTKGEPS